MATVIEGIVVGGAGGAVAGITVYLVQFLHHRKKIEKWLGMNTEDKAGSRFRSTRAIASWNNLTEDRVRYICSHSESIFLSTGTKEDMWGVIRRESDFPDSDDDFIRGRT
jgi:hypothetical protein